VVLVGSRFVVEILGFFRIGGLFVRFIIVVWVNYEGLIRMIDDDRVR
jgi:hypothetical protein